MATTTAPVDVRAVCRSGVEAGLSFVGVASAEPFDDTRDELIRRRELGLHAGMAFTYRNPDRSTDPRRTLPSVQALVVGALGYHERPAEGDQVGSDGRPTGQVARHAWADRYGLLRSALGAIANELRSLGWQAIVVADDNALVDRAALHRSGLGWYGKNSMLLLGDAGSWFVLGSVLTDAPLPPSGVAGPSRCGACTRCVTACPTGAIVSDGVIDARRCLAWLLQAPGPLPREHRVAVGNRIYGCDDCQEACPWNLRSERRASTSPAGAARLGVEAPPAAVVPLLGVLASGDEELLERFGHWYIPRRDPAHLRRNALVALGNAADPADREVGAAIAAALRDASPLVRSHALWAARRLGLTELVEAAAGDEDPMVREELEAEPPPQRSGA